MKNTCQALLMIAMLSVPAFAEVAEPDHEIAQRSIDPFVPLIQAPRELPPVIRKDEEPQPAKPPVPVILPVQFAVTALAVDGERKVAVIEFMGQTYIVQEGSKVPETGTPAMEVRSVTEEKVVVTDTRLMQLVTKQIAE